nr:MAG: replication associated protein [Cressdnaviricota sp.]
MSRSRLWTYTSFADTEPLNDNDVCIYQLHQREECPDTGRKHWQGMVRFRNPRMLKGVQRYLGDPTAHCEICRNEKKSIAYCRKEESRVGSTIEYGHVAHSEENWWQDQSEHELWANHSEWMLRHHTAYKAYKRTLARANTERAKPQVRIYIGEPGTGKSYCARQHGEYFAKASGPWWDGYTGQSIVIFDDFYGNEQYCDILRWCSELPIRVPIKGDTVPLQATTFIFTSNARPTMWWKNIIDKSAFIRRVTHYYEFCMDHVRILKKATI